MVFSKELPKLTEELGTIGTDNIIYKIVRVKNDHLYSPYYEEEHLGLNKVLLELHPDCINTVITGSTIEIIVSKDYEKYSLEYNTNFEIEEKQNYYKHICKLESTEDYPIVTQQDDGTEVTEEYLKIKLKEVYGLFGREYSDLNFYISAQSDASGRVYYDSPKVLNIPYSEFKEMVNTPSIKQNLIDNHGVTEKTLQRPYDSNHVYPYKVAYKDTITKEITQEEYSSKTPQLLVSGIYSLCTYCYTTGFVFAYRDLEMARRAVEYLTQQRMDRNIKKREDNVWYDQPEEYQYIILKGEIPKSYPDKWHDTPTYKDVYYVQTSDKTTNTAATALGFYDIVEEFDPFIFPPEDDEDTNS